MRTNGTGDRIGPWPRLHEEPTPKPRTFEDHIPEMARKRVDYLITSLGPSAEVLDAQNRVLTGHGLRETMLEREIAKLQDQVDAKKLRCQQIAEARQERNELAEKEILAGWNKYYFLTLDQKRVMKLKKFEFKCPYCGEPHPRIRGALIELWGWRRDHTGTDSEAPVKSGSLRCPKCKESFAFQATTTGLR